MERMRDVLKQNLGRSLKNMSALDRLEAAWPVAGGKLLAAHGRVASYEEGMVRVEVSDPAWLAQMNSMRGVLERELARIAGVRVITIHFEKRTSRE